MKNKFLFDRSESSSESDSDASEMDLEMVIISSIRFLFCIFRWASCFPRVIKVLFEHEFGGNLNAGVAGPEGSPGPRGNPRQRRQNSKWIINTLYHYDRKYIAINFNKRLSTLRIFQNSAAMRFHDRSDGAVPEDRSPR